jgi:hypothetical protein
MAHFAYSGDHTEVETLGFRFRAGVPTEVNDESAIKKLRGNPAFNEVFDGVEVLMPETKPTRKYTRRGQ